MKAVIAIRSKGAFAPIKIGSPKGPFLRNDTLFPHPVWIYQGKVYEDMDEFNADAAKVIPSAYLSSIKAVPIILDDSPAKKRRQKAESSEREPTLKLPSPDQQDQAPTLKLPSPDQQDQAPTLKLPSPDQK